jgi:hypothetical protein
MSKILHIGIFPHHCDFPAVLLTLTCQPLSYLLLLTSYFGLHLTQQIDHTGCKPIFIIEPGNQFNMVAHNRCKRAIYNT